MTAKIIINQENYKEVLELAKVSSSRTDLIKKLGWAKNSTQLFHLNKLLENNSFDFTSFTKINRNKELTIIKEYKRDILEKYAAKSYSYAELLRSFGKSISGGSTRILKRYIKEYNIDTSHFDLKHKYLNPAYSRQKSNNEIFIENSPVVTSIVKSRILKENLIEYKCYGDGCNVKEDWLGKNITLQLEHKNGNNRDHRLENLEFLCPNCHSLTLTWGARNIKNKNKIKSGEVFIRKLHLDKDNLLENILPQCNTTKEVIDRYNLIDHGQSYKGLDLILKKNLNHPNVKDFIKNKEVKKISYPPIDELIKMIKSNGFVQTGIKLGCSDNAIRKYLNKQKIDIKNLK